MNSKRHSSDSLDTQQTRVKAKEFVAMLVYGNVDPVFGVVDDSSEGVVKTVEVTVLALVSMMPLFK